MEKWSKYGMIAECVQALGTICIVVALAQTQCSLVADHERSRRQVTLELWDKWRQAIDSSSTMRANMMRIEAHGIDTATARRIIVSPSSPQSEVSLQQMHEDQQLKNDCVALLNLFEQIAVAYKYNVGDRELIRESFRKAMERSYLRLNNFILVWEQENGSRWRVLDDVVMEWQKSDAASDRPPLAKY